MNKIFKVVWSKVRNCYVVVSEIAKNTVSGVGKRNRIGKVSLAATLAASVLTSGFVMPNEVWAAENNIALAQKENYIAYQANQTEVEQYKNNLGFKNNKNYVFTKSGDQYFWVQEGYTIYTREANIVYHDGTTTTDVVYKITGEAKNSSFDAISTIQVHDDQSGVTTVLNDTLDNVTLNPFGAASNSTATEVYNSYTFVLNEGGRDQVVIKTNGATDPDTGVTPEPFTRYFKTLGTNKASGLYYDEATKTYTYKGEHVHNNSVYYINTGGGYQTGVFVINDKVYDGTVKGANGEKLLTGQIYETETDRYGNTKTTSSLVTYWGVEVENYNLTLAESKMTIGNLREAFNILKNNDDVLSRADIKRITLTPNATSNSAVIGLNYNLNEEVVPGAITITSGGGVPGNDTFVTLTNTAENGSTQTVTLKTGSVVVGNPSLEGADTTPLTAISINGSFYTLPKVDTDVTDSGLVINNIGDEPDSEGRHHRWEIKDTKDDKIYADTTLVAKTSSGTYNAETKSNSYTIEDTAGNQVVLNDVASASQIRTELDNYNTRITNLSNNTIKNITIDSSAKTIALIKDDTGSTPVTGTLSINSGGGQQVSIGENVVYEDTYVTITNQQNTTGIKLNTGSKVEAVKTSDGERLSAIKINGENFEIPTFNQIDDQIEFKDYYLRHGSEVSITVGTGEDVNIVGAYKVSDAGVIALDVKNDGTNPHKVYIADVAKYSDVGDVDELQRYADSYQISNNVTKHIDNLYEEVTNTKAEALKHTVVSGSKNIEVTKFQDGINYNVKLKDYVVLGDLDKDDSQIILDGDNGYIFARRHDNTKPDGEKLVGEITIDASKNEVRVGLDGGKQVIVNGGDVAEVTGLTNRTIPWENSSWTGIGRAATEEQLRLVDNKVEAISFGVNGSNKSIGLVGKDNDGNSKSLGDIAISTSVNSSTGEREIVFGDTTNGGFALTTGSKVSANSEKNTYTEGEALEDITVNGRKYTVATAASVNAAKTEVVSGDSNITVTSSSQNTDGHTTYSVAVKNMRVKEGMATYLTAAESGNVIGDGSITLEHQDGSTATITGLHDYYATELDVVTGANGSKDLVLTLNNGSTVEMDLAKITSGLGTMNSWTAKANGKDIVVDNNNNVLEFVKGNDNIVLDVDNGKITVATAENVSFTTVNVGSNVSINQNGVVVENGDNDIVLAKTNVSVGGNRIQNVAAGTADTDAVNFGQLKDARTKVVNGKNTTVRESLNDTTNQYTYSIDLEDNITLGSDTSKQINIDGTSGKVKVGNVVEVSTAGINVGNKVNISADGIAMGSTKITGLAAGENPNDAVNMSQLNAVSETVNKGWNLNVSDSASYKVVPDGDVTLQSANDNLQIANVNGVVTFTAKDDFIDTAGFNIDTGTLTLGYDGNGRTALTVTGLMNSWTAQVGSETLTVGNKDVVSYIAGNNIDLTIADDTANGGGSITVATDNVVTFDSVTVNGSTTGNNVVINSSGINAGGYDITNVGAGEISQTSKDAVNGGQLWSALQQDIKEITITKSGTNGYDTINLVRENGSLVPGTLKFTSGGGTWNDTTNFAEDTYIVISQQGTEQGIKLYTGSKVIANPTEVNSNVTRLDKIIINGVAYTIPDPDEYFQDATTGEQITDYHLVNGGVHIDINGDGNKDYIENTNEEITGYEVDEYGVVTLQVYNKHKQETGSVHANVRIADVASKSNLDALIEVVGDGNNLNSSELGQNNIDNTVVNHINNLYSKVENATTEAGVKTTVTEGSNVTVTNSGNDYVVSLSNNVELKDASNNVTVKLNGSDGSVEANSVKVGANVTVDGNGIVVYNDTDDTKDVVFSKDNISVGGNQIHNVAAGVADTDAVNVEQLNNAIANINTDVTAAKTELQAGNNVSIVGVQDTTDGHMVYTVSGTDTIKAGNVEVGNDGSITLKHAGLNDAENGKETKIIGLHDYAVEQQTRQVVNGEVTLKVTDKYKSNNTYDVKITDVASASKLTEVEGKVNTNTQTIQEHTTKIESNTTKIEKEIIDRQIADYEILEQVKGNSQYLDSRINQLGSKVNKVGAGAAALAALHPMDFDPDDKLSFAVGAGNYAGENATALGAFYRPNEKVMMNVAGTYGNGENMVNVGMSFALDRTNNVSNSRTAMAKEIVDLREQVATQGQQIAQLVALVQQLAGTTQPIVPAEQLFPDVPQNHWAYEYVNGLIAKGIIEGYPDGTFGGDRAMTRYEFAAMLFRAMEQGVVINEQVRQEFEPELGRIRVDRVKGTDADLNKIERVRVNAAIDRDDYGSKVVQVKH